MSNYCFYGRFQCKFFEISLINFQLMRIVREFFLKKDYQFHLKKIIFPKYNIIIQKILVQLSILQRRSKKNKKGQTSEKIENICIKIFIFLQYHFKSMDSNLFSGGPSNGNNYDLNLFYPQQQSGYQYPSFSQMGIFPGFQNVPYLYRQQHLNPMPEQMNIKLENMFRNQPFYPSSQGRNQKKFESNKVKSISKNTQEALDKLLAPPPQTKHKVAYFDPSNAPVLTTDKQFLVQNQESQKVKIKQYQKEYQQNDNELDSDQSDSNPFIVFRYRRIKKKYKKYIKNSEDFELLSEEQSESLSESESQEPFVKEERNEKKNDSLEFLQEKQKIEESMNSKK